MAFPDRERILAFVREADGPVGRRDIARAFGIRGPDRARLRGLLRDLEDEGVLDPRRGRRTTAAGRLPEVGVVEVTGRDGKGGWLARPAGRDGGEEGPEIRFPEWGRDGGLRAGAKVLARLEQGGDGVYRARVMRILSSAPRTVIGVVGEEAGRPFLRSAEKGGAGRFAVRHAGEAEPGDIVSAVAVPGRRHGERLVDVRERLGRYGPGAVPVLALVEHGIPYEFPAEVLAEAEEVAPAGSAGRTDLRGLPLVTIDGEDARDFDDAVFAEPDGDGWRIVVAIADVAWHVRPGSALDREAERRGNSVYFPDRVVPMLPERLSGGVCSLVPGEDRACLAAEIRIGPRGARRGGRFLRGLMRSSARLTYRGVQDGLDSGSASDTVRHLEGAYGALARARSRRGVLEIELPERRVLLDGAGRVTGMPVEERLVSHRIIEEFMIAANVLAAETLEHRGQACLYRVHDRPDPARVEALRGLLRDLGIKVSPGQLQRPKQFNALLARMRGGPHEAMVNELVLRAQAQAVLSPVNVGHFGLGLARYAHFTSPIRRYGDLVVHRCLIAGLGLGEGGFPDREGGRLHDLGDHLSMTERRAAAAERRTVDRHAAALFGERVGTACRGRITGVQRFGLFVRLDDTGADGLVPADTLGDEGFAHDARRHALVGRRTGSAYRLGDAVDMHVVEADGISGSVILRPVPGASRPGRARRARRRPAGVEGVGPFA